jgi:hypothetical protein
VFIFCNTFGDIILAALSREAQGFSSDAQEMLNKIVFGCGQILAHSSYPGREMSMHERI